ncbi:MAG TPA: hypothetical protein PKV73_01375 [Agriterribacter sp.]|nr:hypothetical protein [Agriterribacter sp.]
MNKQEALTRLTSLENEAKELRKIIEAPEPQQKPSAKEWLLDFLSQEFDKTKLGNDRIIHYRNGQWIFDLDLKTKILWCYFYEVWNIFYNQYGMNCDQVQQLMKDTVLAPLNCKGFTPLGHILI